MRVGRGFWLLWTAASVAGLVGGAGLVDPRKFGAWAVFLGIVSLLSKLANPAAGLGVGFVSVGAITGLALTRLLSQAPPQTRE